MTSYTAAADRYDTMQFRRCGRSGVLLPAISLGLWHNFGHERSYETQRDIVLRAFDLGVTHFDLANNYGPPPGSAEEAFGRILAGLGDGGQNGRQLVERLLHAGRVARQPL